MTGRKYGYSHFAGQSLIHMNKKTEINPFPDDFRQAIRQITAKHGRLITGVCCRVSGGSDSGQTGDSADAGERPAVSEGSGETSNKKSSRAEIHAVVLIKDNADPRRRNKLSGDLERTAAKSGGRFSFTLVGLCEIAGFGNAPSTDLLDLISESAILHDTGMMSVVKFLGTHRRMILNKFREHVVCYALSGSYAAGGHSPDSDIDIVVVVDDTDLKSMSRDELKGGLKDIVRQMADESAKLVGIRQKTDLFVYILTDFWEQLSQASPVLLSLLRESLPLYDTGFIKPCKRLVEMGRIKPSQEAIAGYLDCSNDLLEKSRCRMVEVAMEDVYYAILTATQAALMHFGAIPHSPKDTARHFRRIIAEERIIIEDEYADFLEQTIALRKRHDHGERIRLTGADIDQLITRAEEYCDKVRKLIQSS